MGKSVIDLPDPLEQSAPEPLTRAAPAGVDDLLAQMAGDEIDRLLAEADSPRDPPGEAVAHATPSVEGASVVAEEEGATTAAERSALEMPVEPEAPPAVESDPFGIESTDHSDAAADTDDARDALPAYLRPLAWLNAPLEMLPEAARDAVGKIALLTLFNATAVLIYVLVFRRHH